MKRKQPKRNRKPQPKRAYVKPVIAEEEAFERQALAECYGKAFGMCGSYISS